MFSIQKICVLPTLYLCVLCVSQIKLRLYTYITLTAWFYNLHRVCFLRGTDWVFKYIGLRLVCKGVNIYFRTNSDLCHLQHKLIGFYNPDEKCLQRGTD